MAITTDQYNALLARLITLETSYNDMAVAINSLVALDQVQQLLTISQERTEALEVTVAALEQRVTSIEEEPLS